MFLDNRGLVVEFLRCYQQAAVVTSVARPGLDDKLPNLTPSFGAACRTSMLLSAGLHVVRVA